MTTHEGLVGLVLEQGAPLNLTDVSNHPRFKYFPSINEEPLSSFFGVPLIEFRKTLGVLAIQNRESRLFTPEEETLLVAISTQISGLISKAILVDHLEKEVVKLDKDRDTREPERLEGVAIAGGVAELYTPSRFLLSSDPVAAYGPHRAQTALRNTPSQPAPQPWLPRRATAVRTSRR